MGSTVNPRRLITLAYVVVVAVLVTVIGGFFFDAHAEYLQLKATEANLTRSLADAEERLREQKVALERLRTDPNYVEAVIRQKLDYAKPGETIFRFK